MQGKFEQLEASVVNIPPAVKSIQRGTCSASSTTAQIAVTISAVDPSKCSVHLQGMYGNGSSSYYYTPVLPYVVSLTATTLTISYSGQTASTVSTISWEIVEYY